VVSGAPISGSEIRGASAGCGGGIAAVIAGAPISGSEIRGASAGCSDVDPTGASFGPASGTPPSPTGGSGITSQTDPAPGAEVPPFRARASFGDESLVVRVVGRVDTPLYRPVLNRP
jgi:hypothetical protein